MKKIGKTGSIVSVKAKVVDYCLTLIAAVQLTDQSIVHAHVFERDLAALIPRETIAQERKELPISIIEDISKFANQAMLGRHVEIITLEIDEIKFIKFLPWYQVLFLSPDES